MLSRHRRPVCKAARTEASFRPSLAATLLGVLMVIGCGGERSSLDTSTSSLKCVCPQAMDVTMPLPADVTGPDVIVNAESCSAKYDMTANTIVVAGSGGTSWTCLIHVSSPTAASYSAAVGFQYAGRDCGWRATGVLLPLAREPSPSCTGPAILNLSLPLPADVTHRVADVTSDPSCEATYDAAMNSVDLLGAASAPTCTIIASLDDDSAFSTVVAFPTHVTGCGGYYLANDPTPFPTWESVNGGAPPCSRK
jgi:hypothetical protein